MVEPQVMYWTVLLHIPHHVLVRARGILTLADTSMDPFTELKNRLVESQPPGPVHQHPVGGGAEWEKAFGADGKP